MKDNEGVAAARRARGDARRDARSRAARAATRPPPPTSRRTSSRDRCSRTQGKTIGVVTGIQGLRWFNVEVFGKTDHAGTTPLALRKDALRDAIAIINALHELTRDPTDTVRFTVGRMLVTPNSPNSVASHVLFSVDVRHPDPGDDPAPRRSGRAARRARPRRAAR